MMLAKVDPEPPAHEHDHRGPDLAGDPLRALVASGMDAPLDLDVRAVPDITRRHEVPERPAAMRLRILRRRSRVYLPGHRHGR